MTLSVVINSAADAPHAKHALSSGGVPYSWRAYALQNFILPAYIADPSVDEVIVAGEWHEGEGYTYVPVEPEYRTLADCIAQRQAGFEASTGAWVIFQHDDHIFREPCGFTKFAGVRAGTVDVVSPSRWTYARKTGGEELNSGFEKYIDGHGAVYRREVLRRCPWSEVPVQFTMDVAHTEQVKKKFSVLWAATWQIFDCEYGASPWL